jgi:HEAT repeat protein
MMDPKSARQLLESPNESQALEAARLLGSSGSLADLWALIRVADKTGSTLLKQVALESATALILENLLTKFAEMHPGMRQKLTHILQSLDPMIIDAIARELFSNSDERRLRALQTLGLLRKHPKLREIISKLVQDRDEKIRATAISLLGNYVGPNDHDVIMSLLSDSDKRVRANTVEALEKLGNKRLVPILLRFRKDPSNRIRGNVLKALFTLGYSEIEDDLREMLQKGDSFMKASALWVIAQTKVSHTPLEDMAGKSLLESDEMVVRNARTALEATNTPRAQGYLRYLGTIAIKS